MKTTNAFNKIALASRMLTLIAGLFIFMTGAAQSGSGGVSGGGGGKLDFNSPQLISGTSGADGAVYQFSDIGLNLDARIKITGRSNPQVYLKDIDLTSSGFDKAWQPQVGFNNNSISSPGEWWMDFEVTFVEKGTPKAATIDQFDLTAIDIDGNGDLIREYVSFYGLKSYTIEQSSILSISNLLNILNGITSVVGKRFDGPTLNFVNIDTSGTSVMVTTNYQNVQSFTIRAGAVASGSNSGTERMYSLYYQSFSYTQPSQATLPVKLKSFDTKLNDTKVQIDWTTAEEINFSHFVIERSTNGSDYKEIAVVFGETDPGNKAYIYTDVINTKASGLIYYRLKMVNHDGAIKYSNVRIVKMNVTNETVTVTTYPNPVTSELRITIPANWQNTTVTYELFNMNGVAVKKQINQHASQTETIAVSNLQPGNYVVRLIAGTRSAVQMIAKK